MILALVNNKGGVAKTTTAINLAAGLVERGRRVLLVDADPQGSASLALGVARADLKPSTADVLLDGVSIRRAVRQTGIAGLDLLCGSMDLANADLALADVRGREGRLRSALGPIRGDYQNIVIDCPPGLGLLTVNALVSADGFIVPLSPNYLALEGLVNLLEATDSIKAGIGDGAQLVGIAITMADYRLRETAEIIAMIRGHYKAHVFRAEIPNNVRLAEAPRFSMSIFDYAPSSTGAEAYRQLTAEVLKRTSDLRAR